LLRKELLVTCNRAKSLAYLTTDVSSIIVRFSCVVDFFKYFHPIRNERPVNVSLIFWTHSDYGSLVFLCSFYEVFCIFRRILIRLLA